MDCDRLSEVTQHDLRLTAMVRTTYSDKGEQRPSRGFESVVCPPGGTRVESWRATWVPGGFPT